MLSGSKALNMLILRRTICTHSGNLIKPGHSEEMWSFAKAGIVFLKAAKKVIELTHKSGAVMLLQRVCVVSDGWYSPRHALSVSAINEAMGSSPQVLFLGFSNVMVTIQWCVCWSRIVMWSKVPRCRRSLETASLSSVDKIQKWDEKCIFVDHLLFTDIMVQFIQCLPSVVVFRDANDLDRMRRMAMNFPGL